MRTFSALQDRVFVADQTGDSGVLRDEILGLAGSAMGDLAHVIPENSYWGLAGYSIIAPPILSYLSSYALPQTEMLGPAWNYIDAACQGISGLQQLFDQTTHRPCVTKMKGLFNLASSIQLVTLTAISATALGPIGFATAFGVSFVLSMDETVRQMRRLYSPSYFFFDSLDELDKTEQLIEAKQKAVAELSQLENQADSSGQPSKNRICKLALKLARSALTKLEEKRERLKEDLDTTLHVDSFNCNGGSIRRSLSYFSGDRQLRNERCKDFLTELRGKEYEKTGRARSDAQKKNEAIKNETKKRLRSALFNSMLWGFAFTGMLLLCIPGMQLAATALIGVASLLYLAKNAKKIAQKAPQIYQFFKQKTCIANDLFFIPALNLSS